MCQWIKCVPSACSFSLHYHYHSSLQIPSLPDLKARTSKVLNYTYSKKLPDMIVCCIILALRRLLQKEPECSNLPELNCEIDTLSKHFISSFSGPVLFGYTLGPRAILSNVLCHTSIVRYVTFCGVSGPYFKFLVICSHKLCATIALTRDSSC